MKQSKIDFSLDDKSNLTLCVSPDYNSCSKRLKAHLEARVYTNIHDLIERRRIYIELMHNSELKQFYNNLFQIIKYELKKIIPDEFDEKRPLFEQKRCIFMNTIQDELSEAIRNNYKNHASIIILRSDTSIYLGRNWIVSDNKDELKELQEIIKNKFDIAIKSNWSKLLEAYFKEIETIHELFTDEISDIIEEVESGELLDGHCDLKVCRSK